MLLDWTWVSVYMSYELCWRSKAHDGNGILSDGNMTLSDGDVALDAWYSMLGRVGMILNIFLPLVHQSASLLHAHNIHTSI